MNAKPGLGSALDFMVDDFSRTLFPLKTNKLIVQNGVQEISAYIEKCIDPQRPEFSFLSQQRVYAAKQNFHLRRTVKLDPVAEYYLYNLVYKTEPGLRRPHVSTRKHFGYRFEGGEPVVPSEAYKTFKSSVSMYKALHENFISFDVASYFNSVYHHDLVRWFARSGASNEDTEGFGQFLREINAGRSVDCLPQGLYPAKMIGNDFLRFVEEDHRLGT